MSIKELLLKCKEEDKELYESLIFRNNDIILDELKDRINTAVLLWDKLVETQSCFDNKGNDFIFIYSTNDGAYKVKETGTYATHEKGIPVLYEVQFVNKKNKNSIICFVSSLKKVQTEIKKFEKFRKILNDK